MSDNRLISPVLRMLLTVAALTLSAQKSALSQSARALMEKEIEVFRLLDDSILVITSRTWSVDTGSIIVPENRSAGMSRPLRLPVHRILALDPDQKGAPVFWLSGGPGQTNMRSLQYDYFIGDHDHVMVGYRGVDGDVSLDCPEIIEVLEQGGDILSEEVIAGVADGYGRCSERLIGEGVDLDGYTALEVANDLEKARTALGYHKIIILAESFGTRIAYLYSQLYPQNIERMVMVGSNPPGRMVWDPYQNDRLIRRYADLWKADPDASRRLPDLEEAFRTVRDHFPTSWLFLPIHEGTVRSSMHAFLFHTGSSVQGIDAYVAASEGDASGLWLISFVGSGIFPTVVNWGDNASKAMSADYDPTIDYRRQQDPDDALFGAPLGAFLWSAAGEGSWPISSLPERYRSVEFTDVPTLFVSGSLDLSTPAANVDEELLPKFPQGVHVIVSEAGHILDLWRSQPAAMRTLLRTYIRSGEIDTSRFINKPVSFNVAWGFPVLAKISIAAIVVVLFLLGGGVIVAIRRFRRMKRISHVPS